MTLVPIPTLDELAAAPERAREVPPPVAADLLAKLAGLQPVLLARALAGANGQEVPAEDRLLTVAETAKTLGVSRDWLYRRASTLPFTVRLGAQVRFSGQGLARWMKTRRGA